MAKKRAVKKSEPKEKKNTKEDTGKDSLGRFKIGNQIWKLRSKHGRDKLFKTPELLLDSAQEYFNHCNENPFVEHEIITSNGKQTSKEKYRQRPFTLEGFRLYIGASEAYWRNFKTAEIAKDDSDFLSVIEAIESTVANNQLSGAASGIFNANIVARKLGLADKNELTGKDGNPIEVKHTKQVFKLGDQEVSFE